ncbi:CapA family protein [Curtobacterium sp. MCBD17_026]|uniref:CapA family protein n=1 Tax=Curtobacterium sp. MCBD17_026 TaxID=2175621 RepID=UPI000DAA5C61|nr:CapA family protein [Curtobacterium sp. MCBD17_026]WIB72555.1 CapA family protein [Curtobacterium sp. MCBD17_026]
MSLFAVGDVFVDRADVGTAYPNGDPFLAQGDIVFGNCEGVYGESLVPAVTTGAPVIAPAVNVEALQRAGFDVMSCANNHVGDGGPAGVVATADALEAHGISAVGAGADIQAARKPVVVERGGVRVAFLAYASVFPYGYEATHHRAGLAPIRSRTAYFPPDEYLWEPGAQPTIHTEEAAEDIEALRADIAAAKDAADVVIVSVHWGEMMRPFVLMDHERRIARTIIHAGADAILGHHHHMLRGIEFYKGKPIWYGLGHHLFDLPDLAERVAAVGGELPGIDPKDDDAIDRLHDPYRLGTRAGYPHLPFHPDGRLTGVAVMTIGTDVVGGASGAGVLLERLPGRTAPATRHRDGRPYWASQRNGALPRWLKGRKPKLSEKREALLVSMHWSGDYTSAELAELSDVARATVYRAITRREAADQTPSLPRVDD